MTRHLYFIATSLLLAACRIGGPDGDFAAVQDMDAGAPLRDAGSVLDAKPAVVVDAAPHDTGVVAVHDAASMLSCEPPKGLACNPVSGAGCLPFMQCLGDDTSKTPAANCVLGGIMLGAECSQDGFSTNCPSQHTCLMGACRKYCFCDADCGDAGACVEPGRDAGSFRICR